MAATPGGTKSYFEKLKRKVPGDAPAVAHRTLGGTELMVSTVGFGGYRIHEFEPDHREALRLALLSGCNLIDTSSNYTDGSSERLIGQVTTDLFECGALKREQIVFVTKAGYVQGQNLKEARLRKERGEGFPDMVEFQPDCWHNISPAFLEDQIGKSLERLRLSTIDILLLHNPEYFLKASGAREIYYQRIEQAFRHLEGECQKGRIRYYGISSNTFPEDEARSDFTSLSRVVEIAESIALESGKKHHFAVAQMPFNLFEPGAALSHNNHRKSVLHFAEKKNLGILINRPLNSFSRGRLNRLTSFASHDAVEIKGGLHVTLGRAIELEKTAPGAPKAGQGLQWAHVLRDRLGELDDLLTWKEALYMQIMPSIRQALSRLNADRSTWATEYQEVMQKLFDLISCDLENLAHQKSTVLDEQISQFAPELKEAPTLSQKVLRLYLSFPQISSVLVGMRTPDYVKDTLHASTAPTSTADHALTVLSRFQRHRS